MKTLLETLQIALMIAVCILGLVTVLVVTQPPAPTSSGIG